LLCLGFAAVASSRCLPDPHMGPWLFAPSVSSSFQYGPLCDVMEAGHPHCKDPGHEGEICIRALDTQRHLTSSTYLRPPCDIYDGYCSFHSVPHMARLDGPDAEDDHDLGSTSGRLSIFDWVMPSLVILPALGGAPDVFVISLLILLFPFCTAEAFSVSIAFHRTLPLVMAPHLPSNFAGLVSGAHCPAAVTELSALHSGCVCALCSECVLSCCTSTGSFCSGCRHISGRGCCVLLIVGSADDDGTLTGHTLASFVNLPFTGYRRSESPACGQGSSCDASELPSDFRELHQHWLCRRLVTFHSLGCRRC